MSEMMKGKKRKLRCAMMELKELVWKADKIKFRNEII